MDRSKVKLFEMNEYDWVAAETAEQANEWYKKECGLCEEDQPLGDVKELPLKSVVLTPVEDLTEADITMNFKKKVVESHEYALMPFDYILETTRDIPEPFIAASTEV